MDKDRERKLGKENSLHPFGKKREKEVNNT